MLKAILLVATFVLAAHAFTDAEYKFVFTNWMQQHKRAYTSDEFRMRFAAFKSNMDFVEQWNADPTHTHTVELNLFADMGIEEFANTYFGLNFDGTARLAQDAGKKFEADPAVLGANVNWVQKGAVTPVKSQGGCNACWAFSTTGVVEGINFIKHNSLKSMSEQNLVDCSQSFGLQGCKGGWVDNAFKYIIAKKGLNSESAYPYTGKDGTCHFNPSTVINPISSYADVTPVGNEDALITRINQQPVSLAIDATHSSFQMYKSGVYYEPACSSKQLSHGVLAVGYADAYYLVKNSWGTAWGMSGYIQMARNKNNNCGVATAATSANV